MDIQIWIELGADNAARTINAVEQFGFEFLGMTPADLLEPDKTIELRYPLNWIDLLTGAPGVDFGEAYMARTEIEGMSCIDLKGFKRSRRV